MSNSNKTIIYERRKNSGTSADLYFIFSRSINSKEVTTLILLADCIRMNLKRNFLENPESGTKRLTHNSLISIIDSRAD